MCYGECVAFRRSLVGIWVSVLLRYLHRYLCGPRAHRGQTQVFRLGTECLYLRSHHGGAYLYSLPFPRHTTLAQRPFKGAGCLLLSGLSLGSTISVQCILSSGQQRAL